MGNKALGIGLLVGAGLLWLTGRKSEAGVDPKIQEFANRWAISIDLALQYIAEIKANPDDPKWLSMNPEFVKDLAELAGVKIPSLPPEVIPIQPPEPPTSDYSVSVVFRTEPVCEVSRGDECLKYSSQERRGVILLVNTGRAGVLTIKCQEQRVWLADWDDNPAGSIQSYGNTHDWTDSFIKGQTGQYTFPYYIAATGMPIGLQFEVTVYDLNNELIFDRIYKERP